MESSILCGPMALPDEQDQPPTSRPKRSPAILSPGVTAATKPERLCRQCCPRRPFISRVLKIRRHSLQIPTSQTVFLLKASAVTRPQKTGPADTRQEMNCRVARQCSERESYFGESSQQLNPTAAEANSLSPQKLADARLWNPAEDIQFGRVCPELSRNRRLIASRWRFLSVRESMCRQNPEHSTPSARHTTVPLFPAGDTELESFRLQPSARVDTSRKWPH